MATKTSASLVLIARLRKKRVAASFGLLEYGQVIDDLREFVDHPVEVVFGPGHLTGAQGDHRRGRHTGPVEARDARHETQTGYGSDLPQSR